MRIDQLDRRVGEAVRRLPFRRATPPAVPADRPLRIGYVVWDWPAASQTFVLNEVRSLLELGHDVVVYYAVEAAHPVEPDFEVVSRRVRRPEQLAKRLVADDRDVMHTPFAYPSATRLVWPAAEATGVPFTLMAGGVDVAHHDNIARNRIGEVTFSRHCLGVITLGTFHRDLLLEQGVPSHRLVMERQAVGLLPYRPRPGLGDPPVVAAIGRFVEKKGLDVLVRAAALLPEVEFRLHGYGELDAELRALAVELGARNVRFPGALRSADELEAAYRSADVFALPCRRAANGDLDGLPTVIVEAMSAGVPVVTTDAANIPDLVIDEVTGVLCRQDDPASVADGIRRVLDMSAPRRAALLDAARTMAQDYAHQERSTSTLLRLWRRQGLDIVLVTYDTEGYRNEAETLAIIDRVQRFTSLPCTITVVDNDSDRSFVTTLKRRYRSARDVRVVPLRENVFCGPASNIGFARGSAPYLVYICSKEGFVLRHGWDHQLVRTLETTGAAMGGQLVELARHRTGAEMREYPSFGAWRSRAFAAAEPARRFRHVQGGFFVLRRDVFEKVGGFNPAVPQAGMDVEFSYHLEATGHRLVDVPGIAAITTKTRPALHTLVDEFTVAVHPSDVEGVVRLDRIVARRRRSCPACGWVGRSFARDGEQARCPRCGSSPFARTAVRTLSQTGLLQTRPRGLLVVREPSVHGALRQVCPDLVVVEAGSGEEADGVLAAHAADPRGLVVVDRYEGDPLARGRAVQQVLAPDGVAVLAAPEVGDPAALAAALGGNGPEPRVVRLISGACAFDPYPVLLLGCPWDDPVTQGTSC